MVAAHIEPVGEPVAQRPATAQPQALRVLRAQRGLHFVADGALRGFFWHHVDHAANAAFAAGDRGWAAQYLDAFDGPGVERKGDAGAAILPQAIVELHHR